MSQKLMMVITHGDVAHFNGFETLDERAVLPQLGFTIEPLLARVWRSQRN